ATLAVNDRPENASLVAGEYARLQREWHDGDVVTLNIPMSLRAIVGEHGNRGKVAFARGPLILAADDALNPNAAIGSYAMPATDVNLLAGKWTGAQRASVNAVRTTGSPESDANETFPLNLISFAEAGTSLTPYQVWLPLRQAREQ